MRKVIFFLSEAIQANVGDRLNDYFCLFRILPNFTIIPNIYMHMFIHIYTHTDIWWKYFLEKQNYWKIISPYLNFSLGQRNININTFS